MASTRILPANRSRRSSRKRCIGIASTMRPAYLTTSSVESARAPGASTSTISSMRSANPDPEIATSYPPATAARAIAVPALPAPTIPRRRSVGSLLDTGRSPVRARQAGVAWCRLLGRIREQLPDSRDHLPSVQFDGRHLLFVRYSPRRVGQIEPAQPEQANDPRNFGRDRFHRPEIHRSFVDLGLESIHRRPRPPALSRGLLEDMSPMWPLNVRGFLVGSGHQPVRVHTDPLQRLSVLVESSFVELDQR